MELSMILYVMFSPLYWVELVYLHDLLSIFPAVVSLSDNIGVQMEKKYNNIGITIWSKCRNKRCFIGIKVCQILLEVWNL